MKYSAGTVAGLCNRMFHAALPVGVGLLGFPGSQDQGSRPLPHTGGRCADGLVGKPPRGALSRGRGRGPCSCTLALPACRVALRPGVQKVGELQWGWSGVSRVRHAAPRDAGGDGGSSWCTEDAQGLPSTKLPPRGYSQPPLMQMRKLRVVWALRSCVQRRLGPFFPPQPQPHCPPSSPSALTLWE